MLILLSLTIGIVSLSLAQMDDGSEEQKEVTKVIVNEKPIEGKQFPPEPSLVMSSLPDGFVVTAKDFRTYQVISVFQVQKNGKIVQTDRKKFLYDTP